jgi:hypothetical protein
VVSIATLLQFLVEGDWLGFLQAVYVAAFGSADIFYAVLIMMFMSPLYIRTKSLLLVCILWILIGGGIITVAPLLSNLAMFLMVFGIAGILYRVFIQRGD